MKKILALVVFLAQALAFAENTAITTDQKYLLNNKFSYGVANKVQLGTLIESGLSNAIMAYADVTITAAQLDALNATPITLVAAPGAGKVTVVNNVFCFVDFVSVRLELGSGVVEFRYTDGSGVKVAADLPNTTAELNADTYYNAVGASGVSVVNAAIVADASADVTSGDSILRCRTFYRVVTLSDI